MTQLTLTDVEFFKNGVGGQTALVGYESENTWVARYAFTVPAIGATSQVFSLQGITHGEGAAIDLHYRITSDPLSHASADENSPFHGLLVILDGAVTFQSSFFLNPGATYYLWIFPGENRWGWYRFPTTGTVTCDGISQGFPSVAAAEGELGQPLEIHIQTDPAYTHRLSWQFGSKNGIIGENLGSSVTWTPELSMAAAIPNQSTGLCAIRCQTYLGGSPIGVSAEVTVRLRVPQSLAPQVSAVYYDTSEAHDVFDFLVEKISRLWVAPTAQGAYGAQIAATAALLDGKPYTGAALPAGDHILAVTATDTRGLTGTVTYPITVEPYKVPQLTLQASRCLQDGTPDDTGGYALVTFTGTVAPLAGNMLELTFTYGSMTVNIPLTEDVFATQTVVEADPEKTLSLSAQLRDSLRKTVRSMTLSTAYATLDFYKNGKGIALGAVATGEGFHCAMDARFLGSVTDSQGRNLVTLTALTPLEGTDMTLTYGRVLWLLGAPTLQLQFTATAEIPKGTQLFTGVAGLSKTQTLWDAAGAYKLKASSAKIQTDSVFPTGTYTFHAALY